MNTELLTQGNYAHGLSLYGQFNMEIGFRELETYKKPTPQSSHCYEHYYHPFGLERPESTRFVGIQDQPELSYNLFMIHLHSYFRNYAEGCKDTRLLRVITFKDDVNSISLSPSVFFEIRMGTKYRDRGHLFGAYANETGAYRFIREKTDVFAFIAKITDLKVEFHEVRRIEVPDLYLETSPVEILQAS
ncbi:MAG: hypothetical protein V4524_00795 [Patescibacteria group bacterium]